MVRLLFIGLMGLLLLASASPARAATPDAAAVADAMLQRVRVAWRAQDGAALGRLYAADGDLITPYGICSVGPGAVGAFYTMAMQRGYGGSDAGGSVTRARFLDPRTILADGTWFIRGAKDSKGAPRPAEEGLYTIVLRRIGSEWRVAALREYLRS